LTIEEYNFPHAIALHDSALKSESLLAEYRKCYQYLKLDKHPDVGITIIVTPKWLFVAPLTSPYTEQHGMPVYADAYAYLGILNIQNLELEWPATAGIATEIGTHLLPFDVLERSSNFIANVDSK